MRLFAIGTFGRYGEKVSLGFVEETEKQVVAHLDKHLNKISSKDKATIEILKTMREDEDTHAQQAVENGGEELEIPTKKIMKYTAKVMTLQVLISRKSIHTLLKKYEKNNPM